MSVSVPIYVHLPLYTFLSDSVSALILPSSFLSLSVSHPLVGRRQSADCKIRKTHKKLQTLIPMSSRLAIPLSRTHANLEHWPAGRQRSDAGPQGGGAGGEVGLIPDRLLSKRERWEKRRREGGWGLSYCM